MSVEQRTTSSDSPTNHPASDRSTAGESAAAERADEERARRGDRRWAALGGLAAALVGFGGMALVGGATSFEARRLLESVLPTARFAASAYIAGGATILALMLTIITFSLSHELDFRVDHYKRIRDISLLTTAMIVASVLLLMFLSFPLGEADVDLRWYPWVYYALLLGSAVSGGVFITVILMLVTAVRGLLTLGIDPTRSELVRTEGTRQ